MAKLSRGRARRLAPVVVLVAALLAPAARADAVAASAVDLVGTWHVLIHYRDDHAHDPDQLRWDDRVWVFEKSGNGLRWTEYAIVLFADESGRFERLGGSRASRVVHGWEPNAAQAQQIAAGLEVNPRGSKSKTLKQQRDGGWHSSARPAASAATVVTYVESWSIVNPTTRPVFRREDTLGSEAVESVEGVTEFTTLEVSAGGNVLSGSFERDGSRHGTFRLTRSGSANAVKGKAKSEGQRFYEMFFGDAFRTAFTQGGGALESIDTRNQAGGDEVESGTREKVRSEIRTAIEDSIREADQDPRLYEREVGSLSRRIADELLDEGRSRAEIERMLAEGEINP